MLSGCLATSANCASANCLASAFAAFFSASDKSVRLSSSAFLAFNSSAIACLAFSFATGLTFATAPVPSVLAVSTSVAFVASSILSNAACLSSLTLALAFSFSAGDKAGLSLIALILLSASVVTASIAGCLSNLATLSTGIVSLEPSLYVTTNLSPSCFTVSTAFLTLSAETASSLLMFLSLFFLEYSNWRFSLILSNSACGILALSVITTFSASVNSLTSYLAVWAFKTILNPPGSFEYDEPVALLKIFLPSLSVAVA